MSKHHSTTTEPRGHALPEHEEGFRRAWTRFWFAPTDPIGLHVVRFLAGLLFLSWLLPFAGHQAAFFGLDGWLDQQGLIDTVRVSEGTVMPPWSILYLAGDNTTALVAIYWSAVAVLALFTLGVWPRLTAVLTWVAVASFTANPALEYEGDAILLMLAFYLMVGYVLIGQSRSEQSIASRILGPTCLCGVTRADATLPFAGPSVAANLTMRLIQIHFAIFMVTSGLHKLQFGDWWAGVALWFPYFPAFKTKLPDVLALKPQVDSVLYLFNIATYATLAWQIGFPIFAWKSWGRPLLLAGGLLSWLACFWIYATPLVGPAILLCCLSYLPASSWRWVARKPPTAADRSDSTAVAGPRNAAGTALAAAPQSR